MKTPKDFNLWEHQKNFSGLPQPPYFLRDWKTGKVVIHFNHQTITWAKVLQHKEELERFFDLLSPKDIDLYNQQLAYDEEQELLRPRTKVPPTRERGFVYLLKCNGLFKIGRAKDASRINIYQTENPFPVEVIK